MNAQSARVRARVQGTGCTSLLSGVAGIVLAFCSVHPGLAQAAGDDIPMQDLLKKLEERDLTILDLVNRVRQLEQRLDAVTSAPAGTAPAKAAPAGAAVAADAAARGPTAQAEPPTTPPTPPAAESRAPAAAPGAFSVDPKAAERALERTLVQAGALLLPLGAVDVEPGFTYVRQETTIPRLTGSGDDTGVETLDIRENGLTGSLDLRFGLPWTSQFELSVPYTYNDLSQVSGDTEDSANASGFGDVRVGLAKAVLSERGWRPDLIARVTWDADTGQEKNGFVFGSGFHSITADLTALKRQDPLAFVASGFYRTSFEKDNVEPGDEFGFIMGTVLAASPDTSLSLSLQQTFSKELKVGGSSLPGSDQLSSVLVAGASSVLGRGVLLSVNAGVGLTEDAPDYFVGVSLPIRFNLPIR